MPSGLAPSNTTVSGQPVLQWNRVRGAATYEVQLSSSSDFSTLPYTVSTTNRRATPTVNLPRTRLHWRVRGWTATGVAGSWATASFTSSAIGAPALQTPLGGAALQQPEEPALLSWSPVAKAVNYTIEVDNDDQFVQPTTYPTPATSYVLPDPGPAQTYHWRVRANFAGGFASVWSSPRRFSILPVREPALRLPANGSTMTDAVLDWQPVPGATRYEVRVGTDDQFNMVTDQVTAVSTRYARPNTYDNDAFWWQVRSIDVNNNKSPWGEVKREFRRAWPDKPVLRHPADGATQVPDPFYYQWAPVPHASRYRIDVGPDENFSPGTFVSCFTKSTTYTARFLGDACSPTSGIPHFWRVRAFDDNSQVNSIYSDIRSFTYSDRMVQLLSPADDVEVDVPTLTWAPARDALTYEVVVSNNAGTTVASTVTHALSWTPNTRLVTDQGPFHWTVRSIDEQGGRSVIPFLGSGRHFSLSGLTRDTELAPLSPTVAPADSHSVRFPSLRWEPAFVGSNPVTHYKVFVGPASSSYVDPEPIGIFQYAAGTDVRPKYLRPGDYKWFVQAFDGATQVGPNGPLGYFTVDNLASVTGQQLSLTGAGLQSPATTCDRSLDDPTQALRVCTNLQQTPVLEWDPVPGVSHYMVYLARDRELTNLEPNFQAVTASTMRTPTESLQDSQAQEAYHWFIRPCKMSGFCAPDPTSATHAFDKRSNPVTGLVEQQHDTTALLPDHGPGGPGDPVAFADEVTLRWDGYLAANQRGNGLDVTGMASTVEALSYRVQIAADPGFGQPLVDATVDQTSYTPYANTLPEGPLYWRVQAYDGSSRLSSWSLRRNIGERGELEKRSPRPELLLPAADSAVAGTPYFRWAPLAYASYYEVQVYRDGSSPTFLFSGTSKQTTFASPIALSAAGSPYLWRVRRYDVSSLPGKWTTFRKFTVKGAAPRPVSPGAGAYVSARDPYFTWRA